MVLRVKTEREGNVAEESEREREESDEVAIVLEVDVVHDEEAGSEDAEDEGEQREL